MHLHCLLMANKCYREVVGNPASSNNEEKKRASSVKKNFYQQQNVVNQLTRSPTKIEIKIIDETSTADKSPLIDFDYVLPLIGEFGTYQMILFFLAAPFCFFEAFSLFSQVFITLVPGHSCHVPQLNNSGLTITEKREISIPLVTNSLLGGGSLTFDSCRMYDVDYKLVLLNGLRPNATWPTKLCQDGWDYDLEQIRYHSVVTENDWVCDQASKVPLAQAVYFCGSIVGGILLGFIADSFGRIPALILCNLIGALAGVITAISTSFSLFVFSRFLIGITFDNALMLMYILVLEYVGPSYRTLVGNLSIALFYTTGTTILPWMAWGIRDWRIFSLATSVPMVLVIAAYWTIPESARWLLSQGQTDRAVSILRKIARINKKEVDQCIYKELMIATEKAMQIRSQEPKRTALDLLRTPRLRRNIVLLTLLWVTIAVVYDGHARNTTNLGLSVFLTFSVASVTELPADLVVVFLLDRWGRRALAFGSLLGAAIFSLIPLVIPNENAVLSAVMAIIGRFCVNITYNIGLQYGAELIPTPVRAQGIAYVHTAGYVATILSPYIVDLARFAPFLPLTVLGLLALIGAITGLLLPETMGETLPESMEDGEKFGKDQRFWDFPFCHKKKSKGIGTLSSRICRASNRGELYRPHFMVQQMSQPRQVEPADLECLDWPSPCVQETAKL